MTKEEREKAIDALKISAPNGFKCSKCLIVHSQTSIFCPSCGCRMSEVNK